MVDHGFAVADGPARSILSWSQFMAFLENETLTPEHPEVLEIGLVPGEYLIRSLVQAFAEIEPIGCMTSCVDGFGQKLYGDLNSAIMVLAASINVRFFLSATPFC